MIPLMLYNVLFFLRFGPNRTGQLILFNCTIPSLIFFYFLSKYRDGRFFFTFCLADTISIEVIDLTNIIDFYLPGDFYLTMFLLRLIAFPLLEWIALKWLSKPFKEMQESIKEGWTAFAAISMVFYLLFILTANYPTIITGRPQYLPAFFLLSALMPMIYWCIFFTLFRQQKIYQMRERENLLRLQSSMMESRIEEITRSQEQLAIERHDLRHRFQILSTMLTHDDIQGAQQYIASSDRALSGTQIKRWCLNPVLDAVFSSYFLTAQEQDIRIEAEIDIPKNIRFDAVALSTVFGNALENAIQAVVKLPKEQRVIHCRCIRHPQLMFRISNPYEGVIRFDSDHFPVSEKEGHGIGSRSIAAYCEKHGAFCDYTAEDGWFTMQLVQPE